jgi:hypothetical protein
MNEYVIGYTAVGSLLGMAVACLLYMLGGRDGKWRRRFIGSLVLSTTLMVCAYIMHRFNWWLALTYPALAIGFSFGYGADTNLGKVVRRTIYALAVMSAGVVCAVVMKGNAWMVLVPHIGIGLWSVWLGVKNPLYAASEEVFVCASLSLGLMMYPFIC